MKNVIITGGAGFIGSNMVRFLHNREKEWRIVVYDKLTYAGNLENLRDLEGSERFRFIQGDLCDGQKFEDILKEFNPFLIYHFAAESHVDRSILDPSPFIRTNIEGTQVLLHCIMKFYPSTKLIHISTDEVYGSAKENEFFDEDSHLNPSSPYSASKASADLLIKSYIKTFNLKAIIVRPSNNYGPFQFPEKLIPLTISNVMEGKEIPVYGDGLNERDWIYVEDTCEGVHAVSLKGKLSEVYNLGGEQIKKNIEVVKTIFKTLSGDESLIKYIKDRPGHDRRYAMNCEKIKKDTGWKPKISFEEGIKKTIEWYSKNKEWWKRIKSGEYLKYYEIQYGKRKEGNL